MADITSTFANLSSTESSNAPSGSTAVGTGLDDNLRMIEAHQAAARDASGWFGLTLSSVAGTNTVTGSVAAQGSVTMAPTAYSTGMRFTFTAAATNTGAVTLNVSSLGAKNVFFGGRACIGGELKSGQSYEVQYDGTQFQIIGSRDINTFTADASPDGTNDLVETYDASASGPKKVTLNNLILGTGGASGTSTVLLGTTTVASVASVTLGTSAVANVSFDWTAYDEYEVHLVNFTPAANGSILQFQISQNGGTTFISTGTYSNSQFSYSGTTSSVSTNSGVTANAITPTTQSNSSGVFDGVLVMKKPSSLVLKNWVTRDVVFVNSGGILSGGQSICNQSSTAAYNGLKLFYDIGNTQTGTVYVYGIKKS